MAAVRKWEMLAARWKWAPGSEKIKANMDTGNKIFVKHRRQDWRFSRTKGLCGGAKQRQRKSKKRAAREKFVFLLIRSTDLDAIFIAVPV